ncbi:bone morphogenetic protein 2-like isoform X2 [Lepidochelys kempii]|uniref:bone morphogenetic protein 2-like isoform X2 n=1 Tax=Lepidochelys kempii TaxID=8472 RepID=UPI003C6F68E2
MLDFLRTKKDRQMELPLSTGAERSCPLDSHCEPTRVHVERVLLFEGVQEVEVIEACQCNASPEECLRLPSLKTFFPDTPLEFTVDVGKCSNPAHARGGLFCAPVKFDCVLIKSPSGVEVVQTLENCEMKETCYRVSYVEYYYEIIHNSAGDSEERLTEIDVGRCLGSCTSGNHCLLRLQSCNPRPPNVLPEEDSEDTRTEALRRLLEVFGIEDPPRSPHHIKQPPQYMVDLYNTVAGADGITKDPDILEGNTVRSFLDKTHSDEMHFLFILSSVAKNERILTAELHLFRLRTKVAEGPFYKRHHFCQVSVYQVLDKNKLDSFEGKKLLAARLIALQGSGWEVFGITQAVRDWMEEDSSNHGLLVTVRGLGSAPVDPSMVRFASGRDHHESKKPMLVLFTDDGRRGAALPISSLPDLSPKTPDLPAEPLVPEVSGARTARSLDRFLPCQRQLLSVDFEEIGWSGWIISPKSYNAYHCKGSCPFPLGENMRPTNHATVQSIINALKLSQDVSSPCCVPDKLFSINLLYFDDDENVVLKQYDDMVAGSCGCH